MGLRLRLALPLLAAALGVTVAATAGSLWLASRTFTATIRQEQRQFERITANALALRARELENTANILAFVDGPIGVRLAVWNRVAPDAAAIVDGVTGRIRSCEGVRPSPTDLARLAGVPTGRPLLLRAGKGLLLSGCAIDHNRRDRVLIANRIGTEFVDALGSLLQARVRVGVGGATVAQGSPLAAAGPTVPVVSRLVTPGGAEVTMTLDLPAAEALAARGTAVRLTLAAGAVLLLAVGGFHHYFTHVLEETQDGVIRTARLATVGQLVAGISHELNNPLLGVLGHAEYLADKLKPGEAGAEEVAVILAEGRRMKRQLENLRGFVRPGDAVRVSLDPGALAAEVLGLVRHEAAHAGVVCRLEAAAAGGGVVGVSDQVRQVLLNLVMNALQAMPGGGTLTVRTAPAGAAGRPAVRVTVEDTGTGIVPEDMDRIREPFFTTKPGRMGLGLAICQEIIAAHGGTLALSSTPGRGTVATLDLPGEPS